MAAFCPSGVNSGNIFDGAVEIYVDNAFIGATSGGVELSLTTEFGEATADQTPLLIGSFLKSQRGMLKFDLIELTLSNLQLIFNTNGLGTGAGSQCIGPVHEVKMVGNGPNGSTRTITIWKARFHGNTTGTYQRGETVTYSVEIFMEADFSKTDGQKYFNVVDA